MNLLQRLRAWLSPGPSLHEQVETHTIVCRCPRKGQLVNAAPFMMVTRCETHLPMSQWDPVVCQHHAHTYDIPAKSDLEMRGRSSTITRFDDGR